MSFMISALFLSLMAGGPQHEPASGQQKSQQKSTYKAPPAEAKQAVKESTHAMAAPVSVRILLPVAGLDAANQDATITALKGITHKVADTSGAMTSQNVVKDVTASEDHKTITVITTGADTVRLTEIEKTLGGHSVKVDRDRLSLTDEARLCVAGVSSSTDATTLQKAIEDQKTFGMVQVASDSKNPGHASITFPRFSHVNMSDLLKALQASNPKVSVADIEWTHAPMGS